jgi:hypothetical protein
MPGNKEKLGQPDKSQCIINWPHPTRKREVSIACEVLPVTLVSSPFTYPFTAKPRKTVIEFLPYKLPVIFSGFTHSSYCSGVT